MSDIAGAAREGLLAMSVGNSRIVVRSLLRLDLDARVDDMVFTRDASTSPLTAPAEATTGHSRGPRGTIPLTR